MSDRVSLLVSTLCQRFWGSEIKMMNDNNEVRHFNLGLKILSFLYRGVPVQFRPRAPFNSLQTPLKSILPRLDAGFARISTFDFVPFLNAFRLNLNVSFWTLSDGLTRWVSTLCQQPSILVWGRDEVV